MSNVDIAVDVPLRQAKKLIAEFFAAKHGKVLGYGDLMEQFTMPLSKMVKACEALEREGKIKGVER